MGHGDRAVGDLPAVEARRSVSVTVSSTAASARSTSAMKSGFPGVSIRLTATSSTTNDTTADLIVMPRCRSSASESVCVAVIDAADLVNHARGK